MAPGDRIKKARTELGLKQKDVADPLGISPSVISELESGQLQLRQPNAIAMEWLFGVSWRWLMTGKGPMWATELPGWVRERLHAKAEGRPGPAAAPSAPAVPSQVPASPASALSGEAVAQVAQGLAIAQCQAAGTAGDPAAMVDAFKAILTRLQS